MQDFVHLHVHTQYSILDGQASVPRLVDKAMKNGMRGMAITDHGNMMGIKEFFNYTQKKNGPVNADIKSWKKLPNIHLAKQFVWEYIERVHYQKRTLSSYVQSIIITVAISWNNKIKRIITTWKYMNFDAK